MAFDHGSVVRQLKQKTWNRIDGGHWRERLTWLEVLGALNFCKVRNTNLSKLKEGGEKSNW